ncbi:MAG: diguanylate cyclase domain-containing protein, partial [Rhodoferax sp.]
PVELKFDFRHREIGQGLIGVGILQDISQQEAVEDLRRCADTDALTGLPNRRYLQTLFEQINVDRRGQVEAFAFHYMDLDRFKVVNDSLGHPAGDEVLRTVARRIAKVVRNDDVVARVGGDEFVVIQRTARTVRAARLLAEKIIASVSEPMTILNQSVQIGACIGIAMHKAGQGEFNKVSAAADKALYRAKKAGGGRCAVAPGKE